MATDGSRLSNDKIEFLRTLYALLYDKTCSLNDAIERHNKAIPAKPFRGFGCRYDNDDDDDDRKWQEAFDLWNTHHECLLARRSELKFVWDEVGRKFGANDALVAREEFAMKIGSLPFVND